MHALLITIALTAGLSPAGAAQIPCWKVKAAIVLLGSEAAAEKEALARGYTAEQIAAARRRCLGK